MTTLAIVGTGIAGLGCAHFLHRRFDLTFYEQNDYAGGHTNTVTVDEEGRPVPVDTGFMVFNRVTYPLLTRLFSELGVETRPTDMSFSVRHAPDDLEYNGGSLDLLFVQRRNLLRPSHWGMLRQIDRFNREAEELLAQPVHRYDRYSLGDYVRERNYGEAMLHRYLVPMASAVWSTPPERMLDFPALTLLRFWKNHGFLGLHTQHPWLTVAGGARNYVAKLASPFADRLRAGLGLRAVAVRREEGRAVVTASDGSRRAFDKVILAAHADASLALLADPTPLETRLLSPFRYQPNTVTLHTDPSFMPVRKRCWASWNYRIDAGPGGTPLPTTHYWMNRLQGVSEKRDYFVSLNCHDRIAPENILRKIAYSHPLFDLAAVEAQKELPLLNRLSPRQETYYAGAWFRYGFHEDGLASALDCARAVAGEEVWA